jgi:hypothetical protein
MPDYSEGQLSLGSPERLRRWRAEIDIITLQRDNDEIRRAREDLVSTVADVVGTSVEQADDIRDAVEDLIKTVASTAVQESLPPPEN